jgi:hypothetical protein
MCFLLSTLIFVARLAIAQTDSNAANAAVQAAAPHDGQHDFDPLIGTWKFHLKRRLHPLTGSTTWVDLTGTGTCRKIWDGAMLEQAAFTGPVASIEGLVLRLYNPKSHQWSLYWSNRKDGAIVDPPQVGEFKNGKGEFFAQDTIDGRIIYVRFAWDLTNPNVPHFEQSYSDDGGRTWEVNWITDQTRVADEPDKAH